MNNIGIDIGGTSIKGAVVENGIIVHSEKVLTAAARGQGAVINAVFECIEALLPYADKNASIGIACAGDIDVSRGIVVYATDNLPSFTGLKLGEIVGKRFARDVSVVNDALGALLGEIEYGAGRGMRDVVILTLGTGLGCGVMTNGKLLVGHNCKAARLGHLMLYPDGRACTCGARGCMEQYVSATGILKNASDAGVSDCATVAKILKLSQLGSQSERIAVERFLSDLAVAVSVVINIFDPERIIVGGGLSELHEFWWNEFISTLDKGTQNTLCLAKLGNNAGVFGGAHLAIKR